MKQIDFSYKSVPLQMSVGSVLTLSMYATQNLTVGAMSFIIDYPNDLVEIVDVMLPSGTKVFNPTDGEGHLRIAWYNTAPASLVTGQSFGEIVVKVINTIPDAVSIELKTVDYAEVEFADQYAHTIPNVIIQIDAPKQQVIDMSNMTVTQKKIYMGYTSKPYIEKCSNCQSYNAVTRRCAVGGYIVALSGKCSFYTSSI